MTTSSKALLLEEVTTDVNGRAVMQGQADRPLTLMIDGPGHPPMVQSGVSLTEGGELRVVVDRGGGISGRIVPPEALAELRRVAGLPSEGAIPAGREQNWANVNVVGPVERQPGQALPIDAEGRFAGSGIVAGTFDLGVSVRQGQSYSSVRGAPIEVREGEVTEVVFDLSPLLPGVLSGTVTWNGAPLANENVRLDSASAVGRERPGAAQYAVRTDAQGHFELRCLPGSYTLSMSRPGRGNTLSLRTMAEAVVVRDQTTHHTFAIESGKIELTLLDAEGRPAMVGQVMANAENPPRGHQLARGDATGPFQADLEPGEYDLFVLPAGEAISRRMQAAPKGVPFDVNELMRKLRVQIGHASVVAGQTGIGTSTSIPDHPEPTSPPSPAPPTPSTPSPNPAPARHSDRFPAFTPDRSPPAPPAGPRRPLPQSHYPSNSSSPCRGGDRAPASTGTSADSPSDPSTFRIDSGSWIAASSRRGPPHRGHTNTSIRNTRRSSSAHV